MGISSSCTTCHATSKQAVILSHPDWNRTEALSSGLKWLPLDEAIEARKLVMRVRHRRQRGVAAALDEVVLLEERRAVGAQHLIDLRLRPDIESALFLLPRRRLTVRVLYPFI